MKLPFEFKVLTKNKKQYLVVFPNDPSIIWIKKPLLDVLRLANKSSKPKIAKTLLTKYKKDVLMDVYRDIDFLKRLGFMKHRNKRPWTRLRYSNNITPNLIRLHLTHRCNLNCEYCYSLDFRSKYNRLYATDMNWPTAKKAIDWVFKVNKNSSNSYISFMFFGGEPLLNTDVMKRCLEYIKDKYANKDESRAITTSICTNGILIDEKVAMVLKKYNVTVLITIHKKDRQALKKVMIKKIEMLRKFLPDSSIVITYIIGSTKDIKDVKFATRKIKGIVQRFAFDIKLKNQDLQVILEEMKRFINVTIKNKANNSNLPLVYYGNFEEIEAFVNGIKTSENCGAIQNRLSFLPDGSIQPCSGPRGNKISSSIGNINRGGIDKRLYASDIRHARLNNRYKSDCMKCWIRSYCKGVCRYSNKTPCVAEKKNLLCDAYRFFMEYLIKWYSSLSDKAILNIIGSWTSPDRIERGKEKEKYEKTKMILHLRDLRNKRLRYAELITPIIS